jgi:ABC-type Fe3+-siderophore transport system permease subunit
MNKAVGVGLVAGGAALLYYASTGISDVSLILSGGLTTTQWAEVIGGIVLIVIGLVVIFK